MAEMTRVGLSPAAMARAGTMSELDRRRYMKKGGKIGTKKKKKGKGKGKINRSGAALVAKSYAKGSV